MQEDHNMMTRHYTDHRDGSTDHRDGSTDPFSSTHYPVGATVIYTTKKVMDILGNIGTHKNIFEAYLQSKKQLWNQNLLIHPLTLDYCSL